ncbi:MAG: hypothetical protein ABWJ99_05130 [Caldimicrobium sp.]
MQITAPLPIYYLPENLWSLFSRPGRELTVKVLQIEGKLLYLEFGGYKFQARLAGTLNPEDFKPGELLRVKVLKSEGPIVLEVLGSSKESEEAKILYLLAKEKPSIRISQEASNKEWRVLSQILKALISKEEGKDKKVVLKDLDEIIGKNIKISDFVIEEDRVFLPFVFLDEKSWGYIELPVPEEKGDRVKIFVLKLFFQYLGLVEAIFSYSSHFIYLDLYFSENTVFNLAKEELQNLKEELSLLEKSIKINLLKRETRPGLFLERVG